MTAWPELAVAEWEDTRDTLHMWTQIVGKVMLALAPPTNHWWGTTFRVSAHGLRTPLLPHEKGGVEMEFDLRRHALTIDTSWGKRAEVALAPRTVADFYREFRARLKEIGVDVRFFPVPVEIPNVIPFPDDDVHSSYDASSVERFHAVLVSADRVMQAFRAQFVGKASPVHFFWGGFDLAVTRFSGRRAPRHPGGVPNCANWVMEEAYSHEVSSCGYWPNGGPEGLFYSYAYPEPPGFKDARVAPDEAAYAEALGEFAIDVAAVRTAPDPDEALRTFLQSTYECAARTGDWNRADLER